MMLPCQAHLVWLSTVHSGHHPNFSSLLKVLSKSLQSLMVSRGKWAHGHTETFCMPLPWEALAVLVPVRMRRTQSPVIITLVQASSAILEVPSVRRQKILRGGPYAMCTYTDTDTQFVPLTQNGFMRLLSPIETANTPNRVRVLTSGLEVPVQAPLEDPDTPEYQKDWMEFKDNISLITRVLPDEFVHIYGNMHFMLCHEHFPSSSDLGSFQCFASVTCVW